ncbi:MAG: hypothetical protein JST30_16965 [Armatimonadetes bacterium]|nr:hypothetical protein [Armatimonadota bacterium]
MTLATLAFLAVTERPVDFTMAASPLEKVVAKLSETTGKRLSVSPTLAQEVVLVDVRQSDPSVLTERIALVTGGKWVKTSEGDRLELDLESDKKERQTALEQRTKLLADEIAKLGAEAAKQGEFDPQQFQKSLEQARQAMEQARNQGGAQGGPPQGLQQIGGMMNAMPANRAILKLLQALRADDLAKIAPGQRVVYTTAPTRMQRMLPSNGVQVMRQFAADQNKLTESMRTLRQQFGRAGQGANGGAQRQAGTRTIPQTQQQNVQAPPVPSKAFLIVNRVGSNDGLMLQYLVSDATGQIIGQGNMNLLGFRPPAALPAATGGTTAEKPFALSDVSMSSISAFATGGRMQGGPRGLGTNVPSGRSQMPELKEALAKPDTFDPLSIHVEETIGVLAKESNIVALLPDSLLVDSARTLSRNPAPSQVQAAFEQQWGLEVVNKDGWLTVWPARKFEAREARVDRKALAKAIASAKGPAGLRLDDVANYALKAPAGTNGALDLAVMRAVDPTAGDVLQQAYGDNRDVLMMYAAMTPQTKAALFEGRRMPATSVSNNASALLADLVYNSMDGPRVAATQRVTAGPNRQNGTAGSGRNNGTNGQGRGGRRGGGTGGGQEVMVHSGLYAQVGPPQQATGQPGQGRRGGRGGFAAGGPQAGPRGGAAGFIVQPQGGGRGGFGTFGGGNAMTERTEVLPTGVPGATTLVVTVRTEQVAKAVQSDSNAARVFTPQSLAMEKAMFDNPVQTDRPLTNVQWNAYMPGERRMMLFQFTFADGVTMSRMLQDTSYQGSAVSSLDKLPGDFYSQYQSSYKSAQNQFAEMQRRRQEGGQNGRGGRPGGQRGQQRPPGP